MSCISLPITTSARPVLGTFSKGCAGSVSINFCPAGGVYCDPHCRHHTESRAESPDYACYAARTEKRYDRAPLLSKLVRHAARGPEYVARRALEELQSARSLPPWVRFSTDGSLPPADRASRGFRAALIELVEWLAARRIPAHIPVESTSKAAFYRRLLGGLAVVRESLQRDYPKASQGGQWSMVSGFPYMGYRERMAYALESAAILRHSRRAPVVVCPAVLASMRAKCRLGSKKVRCGDCRACALPSVAGVIYPLH